MNWGKRAASQLLRLVPGTLALRRDLREAAWLLEADAVVISYPKSGRTFTRAMLARLYQRKFGVDERSLLEFPALRAAPSNAPRLLFTHAGDAMRRPQEIRIDPATYDGRKLVLIARDPADIAVSRYHHLKHRSRDRARQSLAAQPLDTFVWAEEGCIPSIVTFLNQFAKIPGITIIHYEDFLTKPEKTLKKLAEAIGIEADDEDISDAVAFGKLPNLKELEGKGYFTSKRLRQARKGDARSGKVRRGTSGGYRSELDKDVADRIDRYIIENLDPRLGYSSDRSVTRKPAKHVASGSEAVGAED
jgi:hypothetical protein